MAEVKPNAVSELDKRMALMNESLNEIYVYEFSEDIDVLSLWLDGRERGRRRLVHTRWRKAHV